jgi:chorismate-pyruvate lyase
VLTATNDPQNLLKRYFARNGSTTQFFYELAGCDVQVCILNQQRSEYYLHRESLLFINDSSEPVLFATGVFLINNLSKCQLDELIHTTIPVGTILGVNNISKSRQQVNLSHDKTLLSKLNVSENVCFKRSFELMNGTVKVANLTEVVSSQSLARALKVRPNSYTNTHTNTEIEMEVG